MATCALFLAVNLYHGVAGAPKSATQVERLVLSMVFAAYMDTYMPWQLRLGVFMSFVALFAYAIASGVSTHFRAGMRDVTPRMQVA